jgi:recombination protein RecA
MAVKFFSSTVIKLWSSEAEANAIKAGIKVGDKIIEQRVGRPVNWIIDYNKLGPPNLSGQYDFYYQGENIGVDLVGETLDVAEMLGAVEKGGAWYTVNGERLQGRAKAVTYLRENPKVVDKLIEDIDAKS